MKPWAKKFYKSTAWKKCRESYIISVHAMCERCGEPGKVVHHKILLTPNNIDDSDVTLNHSHLELLCQDCHNKEHHEKFGVTAADLMFDANGNLVPKKIF